MFAPPVSRMAGRLAANVNIYTDGNEPLGAEIRAVLKSTQKFHIENRKIKGFAKDPNVLGQAGVLVTLEDGTVNSEIFVVSQNYPLFFSNDLLIHRAFYIYIIFTNTIGERDTTSVSTDD